MPRKTGPQPDGCRAESLTGPARQVHQAVLAAFARTGQPPTRGELEQLARRLGASPDAVLAELAGADAIAFSPAGEIRAAYPFSPVRTPVRVSWAGGPAAYAMCAIDALGMSVMLGRPVTITAAELDTGRIITVHADGSRARWHPRTAVVFAGSARGPGRAATPRSPARCSPGKARSASASPSSAPCCRPCHHPAPRRRRPRSEMVTAGLARQAGRVSNPVLARMSQAMEAGARRRRRASRRPR
jgi:hypothetical protein